MTEDLERKYRTSHLSGLNAAFVEQLYEEYLDDPESVPEYWRDAFDGLLNGANDDTRHRSIAAHFEALARQPRDSRPVQARRTSSRPACCG